LLCFGSKQKLNPSVARFTCQTLWVHSTLTPIWVGQLLVSESQAALAHSRGPMKGSQSRSPVSGRGVLGAASRSRLSNAWTCPFHYFKFRVSSSEAAVASSGRVENFSNDREFSVESRLQGISWNLFLWKRTNWLVVIQTWSWRSKHAAKENNLPECRCPIWDRISPSAKKTGRTYAFPMLRHAKFPPPFGVVSTFYYRSHVMKRFIPHTHRACPWTGSKTVLYDIYICMIYTFCMYISTYISYIYIYHTILSNSYPANFVGYNWLTGELSSKLAQREESIAREKFKPGLRLKKCGLVVSFELWTQPAPSSWGCPLSVFNQKI